MSKGKSINPREIVKKIPFAELFQENSDGSLTPKRAIRVGGVTFGPGISFGAGVSFGGVEFSKIKGSVLAVSGNINEPDKVIVIKGYY